MRRGIYLTFVVVGVTLIGALIAIPLWDHWYYRSIRSAPTVPLGIILSSPRGPSETASGIRTSRRTQGDKGPSEAEVRRAEARPEEAETASTGFSTAPRSEEVPAPRPVQERAGFTATAPLAEDYSQPPPRDTSGEARPDIAEAMFSPPDFHSSEGAAPLGSEGTPVASPAPFPLLAEVYPPTMNPDPEPSDQTAAEDPIEDPLNLPPADALSRPFPEPMGSPVVSLLLDRETVLAGELFTITVLLTGAPEVTSLPFHLHFDPQVLEFHSARTGIAFRSTSLQPILLASVSPSRPDDLAVGLSLVESSGLLHGSGAVLELEFRALAPGQSHLTFERASLRGATSERLPVEFRSAVVAVR